ncbi:MAG: hypothetical protein KZQ99_05495 [Candidatus Thiodiazotropha sp. (ex Dulcina madagascariensis)]|nr:hypothetical protein [Candidatus Thiodiazotropha sp. (ex Dulcina madagascariensis)]
MNISMEARGVFSIIVRGVILALFRAGGVAIRCRFDQAGLISIKSPVRVMRFNRPVEIECHAVACQWF